MWILNMQNAGYVTVNYLFFLIGLDVGSGLGIGLRSGILLRLALG